MLLRFEVENHRSICPPVELSMIAIDKDRVAARQVVGIQDEQVLTVAALYGANGSGKTNLIDALAWLSYAVVMSLRAWEDSIPVDPFRFFSGSEPTRFGIEMILHDVRYCYELEVEESGVVFEALYSYPQQRRRTLFEREGDDLTFRRGTRLTGGGRELITPTTLVMSVANRLTEEINLVARWLRKIDFVGIRPRAFIRGRARLLSPRFRMTHDWDDRLIDMLGDSLSSEIDGEADLTDTKHNRQRDLALKMLRFADLGVQGAEVINETTTAGPSGRRLRLLHNVSGDPHPLELGDESDGTLTWLGLIPELLSILENGGLLVVDELDASLHPVISGKLVELFQDPAVNLHGGQIIFTTHDTSLLGHLNRDEVWITSKRADGSTELTALSDFRGTNVRRSTNLERGYLQGRFGGVPLVDEFPLREAMSEAGRT